MRTAIRPKRHTSFGFLTAAIVVAPWALVAEAEPYAEKRRQKQATFIAIVGHWLPVDDGGLAFKADGEKWNGQTAAGDLGAVGRSLFPSLTESFVANGIAPGAFPLAAFTQVRDFAEGTLRVQFKLVGGPTDQTAGIVFGLQPTGEYMFIRYNTRDGNVAVWEYGNGQRRVARHGEAHVQLPLDAWHELTVTVSGTKVTGAVSGTSLNVEHTLDKPLTGRVGVWTKRDAISVFKGFQATR